MDVIPFLLRWLHFLAGITWIGLLYYFNLVQTPFFAETEPAVRSGAIQKLVPRALWWFRWGAMFTFLSGILIYLIMWGRQGDTFFHGPYGLAITLGGLLGTIMFLNVWLVIWPNQKIVIQSTTQVAQGGQALPEAAGAGRRAALTSRTNVVFSIPMLFFMGAASHYPSLVREATGGALAGWILFGWGVIALVEINALVGTQGLTKQPLDTVKGTILAGFVLAMYFWLLYTILF